MSTHETIRIMREKNRWSQEEMAEKLNMSPSGYSKIERGETKLYLDKLEQIAQIFNIDLTDLLNNDKNICVLISENSQSSSNYYSGNETLVLENEKLKLSLSYKDQIIAEKDEQIASLKEVIQLLKLRENNL